MERYKLLYAIIAIVVCLVIIFLTTALAVLMGRKSCIGGGIIALVISYLVYNKLVSNQQFKMDKKFAESQFLRIREIFNEQNYKKALSLIDVYAERLEKFNECFLIAGKCHYYEKNYAFAISRFSEVIANYKNKIDNDKIEILYESVLYRGKCYYCKEKFEEAENDFNKIIKLNNYREEITNFKNLNSSC